MKPAAPSKVLVVDNSRLVRERLRGLILELQDVEIIGEASGVAEAIRKIRRLRPQIVLLDISMPDGNGMEVLSAINRTRRNRPHFIILTNFDQEAYRDRCFELGAEYFFDKSAQFQKAVRTIDRLSHKNGVRLARALAH